MTVNFNNQIAAIASKFINNTENHLFLTGRAGTGKTTFLKQIVESTHKNTVVAAPTGIAAINAGGVTLHSLLQLPFGAFIPSNDMIDSDFISAKINTPKSIIGELQINKYKRAMLQEMELLIIDEVSMLRADLLDAIDIVLRTIRKQKGKPFGGVQILFIGDLYQLPPVVKEEEWEHLQNYYTNVYFFNSHALKNNPPIYIELEKIYRQTDQKFINILNRLRDNKLIKEDIEELNKHYNPDFKSTINDGYVNLTTHNRKADALNRRELDKLQLKSFFFEAKIHGDFGEHLFPIDFTLELKKGAQIMFIKNDYSGEQRYFNGKLGIVKHLNDENIVVKFNDGSPDTSVEPYIWENKRYTLNKETGEIEEKVIGTFSQYPLRLAWAITVHKSQGLTFEKAIIDVSKAFAPGQIYVALSRLTSLDGLVLTAPIPIQGIKIDDDLEDFSRLKDSKEQLEIKLDSATKQFIVNSIRYAFNFNYLNNAILYHIESYNKDENRSIKQKYREWAIQLKQNFLPVKEVADKFLKQVNIILEAHQTNALPKLKERADAAKGYFEPLLTNLSENILEQIRELRGIPKIKSYQNELKDLELKFFRQLHYINKCNGLIQCVIKNSELSKEELFKQDIYQERFKHPVGKLSKVKGADLKQKNKNSKEPKISTKEISYNLFKEGKSIEEIAKERSLVTTTIEGHLAHYVAIGELKSDKFIEKSKVEEVIKASRKLETTNLKPIKEFLGNEYSYSELRFAMAAYVHEISQKKE